MYVGVMAFTPNMPDSDFTANLFFIEGTLSVPLDKITTLGRKLALISTSAVMIAITIKGLLHLRALFQNL